MSDKISIPPEIWEKIEKTAKECKATWGMGFPVISIRLLKQILKREESDKPTRSIKKEV